MPRKRDPYAVRLPKRCKHAASGRDVIYYAPWYGKNAYYLDGVSDSPESIAHYERVVAEIRKHKLGLLGVNVPVPKKPERAPTIQTMLRAYTEWALTHYGSDADKEFNHLRRAAQAVWKLYGASPVTEFGPLALKRVRESMIQAGQSRSHINHQVMRIRRIFRWAAENEFCDAALVANLKTVAGLRKGKTAARETKPVRPVAWSEVEKVLPFVAPVVQAMLMVQHWTGMRSDEICAMRACDISQATEIWTYRPALHKTAWRGKLKLVCLGPRAQESIRPYLTDSPEAFLFSPRIANRERKQTRRANRKTPLYGKKGKAQFVDNRAGERFDAHSYQQVINRGFEQLAKSLGHVRPKKAKLIPWLASVGIEHWHPHQLRHSRGTLVRDSYGVEGAQAVLGNTLDATQLYAEKSLTLAMKIAGESG